MSRRSVGLPPEAPTMVFLTAFLGGVLIVMQGLVLLAGGGTAFSIGLVPGASQTPQLGGIGVAAGIGTVAAAFSLQENPLHRRGVGVALLVLGGVSVVSGGGLLVGSGLVVASGLLAVLLRPTSVYDVVRTVPK